MIGEHCNDNTGLIGSKYQPMIMIILIIKKITKCKKDNIDKKIRDKVS